MAITLTSLGRLSSPSNLTTYSLGNVVTSADGLIVICVKGRGASSGTVSATIDGVSAGVVIAGASSVNAIGIFSREMVAGTYAVTATFSTGFQNCSCDAYLLEGYSSATAYDTGDGATASSPATVTLDYPSGGGTGIYCAIKGPTGAFTWSSATPDADAAIESSRQASAHKSSSGAGDSEQVSWGDGFSAAMLGAVWEPAAAGGGNPHYYYQNQAVAA